MLSGLCGSEQWINLVSYDFRDSNMYIQYSNNKSYMTDCWVRPFKRVGNLDHIHIFAPFGFGSSIHWASF